MPGPLLHLQPEGGNPADVSRFTQKSYLFRAAATCHRRAGAQMVTIGRQFSTRADVKDEK
ncbi:hypothetical protein ABA45_01045 [Marinobacter psychrophilus]|uniref:Uncharacterized protein n=1 Tax=Marinobacter psychrophilus TaxID=330734 RepID=A0A0H4HWX3_9GAMM|nr:hypothetical protein ABA45_01045 [Marinobacter psychrophilus]